MHSFLFGAMYISALALGTMFVLWWAKIGSDFLHTVLYSGFIVVAARLASRITGGEPDPACSGFVGTVVLAIGIAVNAHTFTDRTKIPFGDVLLCLFVVHIIIHDVRKVQVEMKHALPVLLIQLLMLGAGLYVLHGLF